MAGKKKLDLVQIIRDNPGATATIDNDCWWLEKKPRSEMPDDIEDEDSWMAENELCRSSDDFKSLGDGGYGSGNCYGGDILQALAAIVGIKVESV